MRNIDYWLGIPLCFLLSSLNYVLKFLSFKEKSVIQKILFVKLSEMGSIILTYPLLRRVREEFLSTEVFFLTFKRNKPVFEVLDRVIPDQNILTVREETIWLFILDTLRIMKKIRKEKIDIVFDLELFSRFTAIFSYLSGAPKRVGFHRYTLEGLYRGNFLTHKVQYNPLLHISKSFLSLYQVMKISTKSTPELEKKLEGKEVTLPRFISIEERRKQVQSKLEKYGVKEGTQLLLINPGDGIIPLREWPLDNFISLTNRFLEDSRNYIVIVGTKEASKKAKLLCNSVNNKRCLDLTGETTLFEILELFSIARALIANDCGLVHLASLTLIKKFILFGPESPQIYGPLGDNNWTIYASSLCSPCFSAFNHRKSACKDNKCLKVIKPDSAYELIREHL